MRLGGGRARRVGSQARRGSRARFIIFRACGSAHAGANPTPIGTHAATAGCAGAPNVSYSYRVYGVPMDVSPFAKAECSRALADAAPRHVACGACELTARSTHETA